MAIDIEAEDLIPLREVPQLSFVPKRRGGKKLHVSTVFRWAQRGLNGVRLETIQFAGTKCTSIAALQRFFDGMTGTDPHSARSDPSPRQRRQPRGRVVTNLESEGFRVRHESE